MAAAHQYAGVPLSTPRAPRLQRRGRLPAVCAQGGDEKVAAPPQKRTPTRKRMIDALLRQSADKMLEAAAAKSAKGSSAKGKKAKTLPPAARVLDADEEVLDLSGLIPRQAAVSEPHFEGGDELLDLDALEAGGEQHRGGDSPALVNTWSYDTDEGSVKYRQIVKPSARGKSGTAARSLEESSPQLASFLSRLEEEEGDDDDDGLIFIDDEFDEDDEVDDEEWDVDAAERELQPQLRTKTKMQQVDVKDVDEVIDALGGLDIRSLDKESQVILQEEYNRKLKERDKLVKRVPDRDNTPPDGKRKTHRQLQIIVGKAANYKLWSPQDMNTRPMMSAVRAAVFSMLTALWHGNGQTGGTFPGQLRWLDLYAGTGAVGIEALSRGAANAHFVELDPWIIQNCLRRNLEHTQCATEAMVHTMTVETYLSEAEKNLRIAGGSAFDMISVCPPYDKVSYPELMACLERSPLVKPGTLLVVEFPKYERKTMVPRIGRLARVRDRRYGRTLVAVYECVADDDSLLSDARAAERDRLDGYGVDDEDYDEAEEDEP